MSYIQPPDDLVSDALSRLGTLQFRAVFFRDLENPLWIEPLTARGVFANEPRQVVTSAGSTYEHWPEGGYLSRMSLVEPDLVAPLLAKLADSANPIVRQVVVRVAVNCAATVERPTISKIVGHVKDPASWSFSSQDIVDLITALARTGRLRDAAKLAEAAFCPRPDPASTAEMGNSFLSGVDRYWYGRSLGAVLESIRIAGGPTVPPAARWLAQFQILTGKASTDQLQDVSVVWRPSITSHQQNSSHNEVGNSLVEALYEEFVAQVGDGQSDPGSLARYLVSSKQPIHRRILLEGLATASHKCPPQVCTFALTELMDVTNLSSEYRREYAHLAAQLLPTVNGDDLAAWEELIRDAPFLGDQEILDRRGVEQGSADAARVCSAYRKHWKLNLLDAIGFDALPAQAAAALTALTAELGAPEHSDFVSYSAFTVGWSPALAANELEAMSFDEVVNFLASWHPPEDAFGAPSLEGQSQAFQEFVSRNVAVSSSRSGDIRNLRPIYIEALFSGLQEALGPHSEDINWIGITTLIESLVAAASKSESPGDADTGQRPAQGFARLVTAAADQQDESVIEHSVQINEALSASIELVIASGDGDSFDFAEPLMHSLNSLAPQALRAMTWLAYRAQRSENASIAAAATAVWRDAVVEQLPRFADDTTMQCAIAAALGHLLNVVESNDGATATALVAAMTPQEHPVSKDRLTAVQRAFWSTVLATQPQTVRVIRLIREFLASVDFEIIENEEWTPEAHSNMSLLDNCLRFVNAAYMVGEIDLDDPMLASGFVSVSAEARGLALENIGRGLCQQDFVESTILVRAMRLWEWRASTVDQQEADPEELSGFAWWVDSGHFSVEWWLPLLVQASAVAAFDQHGILNKGCLSERGVDSASAISVLTNLAVNLTEPWRLYDIAEAACPVIEAALNGGDGPAQCRAQELMDLLGSSGAINLDIEVARLQKERRAARDSAQPAPEGD